MVMLVNVDGDDYYDNEDGYNDIDNVDDEVDKYSSSHLQ